MVRTSLTLGTFDRITGLSNNNVAASKGSVRFFDPEQETIPFILLGPLIINLSINYFDLGKVTPGPCW